MQVWQLIEILAKQPAGNEVVVYMPGTTTAGIELDDFDDESVILRGGDASVLIDENEFCKLSELDQHLSREGEDDATDA